MAIIILPICFISIFLSLGILPGMSISKKELLLFSGIIFSFVVALITELLSLFQLLNYTCTLILWLTIVAANLLYLYAKRDDLRSFWKESGRQTGRFFKDLTVFERVLIVSVIVILGLIFLQGIAYPPTNWDSMTYHLARITSWISHHSVEPFPTAITRQVYEPPFAEYVVMHFNILSRSDYFSAAVQFIFLLLSLVTIAGIVQCLGLTRKYQTGTIVLAATIPEVVLQASSTQNDIVISFFIMAAAYCAFKAINTLLFKYYFFFGLAAGLALLTKGTAYIYLAPIAIVLGIGIIIQLYRTKKPAYFSYAVIAALIAILINSGYYCRNYGFSGNILGVDKTETGNYANEKMGPLLLASNLVKNAALHIGIMHAPSVAITADSAIHKLYAASGININDPATNFRGMKFDIGTDVYSEDSAPNLFHLLLILSAVIILLVDWKKWKDKPLVYSLLIVVVLQVIFFCLYLKWQPWNSRLHVPVFLMAVPLICFGFSLLGRLKKVAYLLLPVLLIYALVTVWHNEWRPISSNVFKKGRYQKYFAGKPEAYTEYASITNAINQSGLKNIGLMIGPDDWQYPLFTNCYSTKLNPIHINVNNITNKSDLKQDVPDCIISTTTNQLFIDYNNKRYYNRDSGNKLIYLYK